MRLGRLAVGFIKNIGFLGATCRKFKANIVGPIEVVAEFHVNSAAPGKDPSKD